MFSSYTGELAALMTAVFWTITALAFESATNKVGSLAVNLIRLILALVFLSVTAYFVRGIALPVDASGFNWLWLSLSGIVGLVIGDYFLFKSYTIITSRISMLVMTIVPPVTALTGWLLMNETMTLFNLLGMFFTLFGISIVILSKKPGEKKIKLSLPVKGLLFAIIAALGQAFGLILSKYGMQDYNFFAATQIRIISGIAGFLLVIAFSRKWIFISQALTNKRAMYSILLGSIFGPFLGISFSLLSIQHTTTGISSTLMGIVPVLILIPSVFIFKQKVTWKDILGATISVAGIILFFVKI